MSSGTIKYVEFESIVYRVYDSINYIAVDNDGEINGYQNEPELMKDSERGEWWIQENGDEMWLGFSGRLDTRMTEV